MTKVRHAIIKTPELYGSRMINIPELVKIKVSQDGLILLSNDDTKPLKPEEIWRVCQTKREAKRLVKKSEAIYQKFLEKLADLSYDLGGSLEDELKKALEISPED